MLGLVWFHYPAHNLRHPVLVTRHDPNTIDKTDLQGELPFGTFPKEGDPFQFIPCTDASILPSLLDNNPKESWKEVFDRNHDHWSWDSSETEDDTSYEGRGVYMCGYFDVPLNYHDDTDKRIVRLAVTKFQVSGLSKNSKTHQKSDRTIIIQPGGPGASGTLKVWRSGEEISKRLSEGKFDVLGWDPRGVNTSLPTMSCFPHDALRDRWRLFSTQYRAASDPDRQFEVADTMNDAILHSCFKRFGDFGRFLGTESVARDLEKIREALGEKTLTAYLISYGTAIGQTYVNLFPDKVGRIIFDATLFIKNERHLGGFGWTMIDDTQTVWQRGFIGECINAGPEKCVLAQPTDSESVTPKSLEERVNCLLDSLIDRPIPAYTKLSGPSLVTYSDVVQLLLLAMYNPDLWPTTAQMLYELERGDATRAATLIDADWGYNPAQPPRYPDPSSREIVNLVTCADSWLPWPDGIRSWQELWEKMTKRSWLGGDNRFNFGFPCKHYEKYWPDLDKYRYKGELNAKLKNPVLIISTTFDPATPLRSGRRLLEAMGDENARLIVHHGYGHTSMADESRDTNRHAKALILEGKIPDERETECVADKKPYRQHLNEISPQSFSPDFW